MAGPEAAKSQLKLTVKEKLLLQLGLHNFDNERGDYPVEVTQKGLAESIGVRRSHVALSLQGLVEDKLVEVKKERIEGEKRRQNIYVLTPNGRARALEIKNRVLSQEADFELPEGIRRVTTEIFLKTSTTSLISVVNQLERGDTIRDEITIVTRPERRLLTVYCPTCMKYLEVENSYVDETVGFDCPGCGRPYKIAPAERVTSRERERESVLDAWPALVLAVALVGGLAAFRIYLESVLCGSVIAIISVAIILVIYLAATRIRDRDEHPRRRIAVKVSLVAVILGFGLIILWDSVVSSLDIFDELMWFLPLAVGVTLSYAAISRTHPELSGEFLLAGGALLLMLAIIVIFVGELGGLSEGSAPLLGVLGVVLLVMATTFPIENNLRIMDLMLAGGVSVLIIASTTILTDIDTVMGALTFSALAVLGVALVSFRSAQQRTDSPLGELFASVLPLAVGALFFITGLFVIGGGSTVAGAVEIGMMVPFIYFGLKKVFDDNWMYRLPIASYLIFTETVSFAYAFMT